MAYGDNTTAYELLKRNASISEIEAAGAINNMRSELGTVTFRDGSFIELRRFNNHQAFLKTGWNITPRKDN